LIAVLLVGLVILIATLALPSAAGAYTCGSLVTCGTESMVFDYKNESTGAFIDACVTWDIPDQPARAFKDDLNRVHLHFAIGPGWVARNIGTSLDDASLSVSAGQGPRHDCSAAVAVSGGQPDPSKYDSFEWLTATYTLDGHTIYGLMHDELRAWLVPPPWYCDLAQYNYDTSKCWYNALVLYYSGNSGDSFIPRYTPPAHLVASVPHQWVSGTGPYGFYQPTNIIRKRPDDGYLYTLVKANVPGQNIRSCLMRTQATEQALADPTSWRAWGDGPDANTTDSFEVQFVNPYTYAFSASDPASAHMCKQIAPNVIGDASESLTYNTYYGKYMLIGVDSGSSPGFYYSLSDDLLNWSSRQRLIDREVFHSYQCGDPDPVVAPSLLDPNSATRNFETTGRDGYLYYVIFHPANCQIDDNRDLLRIPIRFSKAPTASFTVSPNPAPTGQTVTFNASGSTDLDGTIAKYQWDLDGNGSFETDTGTTPTTTRSYSAAGTVAVKLRVTDNDGAWNDTTRNLTIANPSNQPPTASFTVSPNPALTNQTVSFNGSASTDPDGTIANYKWDLDGDGSIETDTGATPTTSHSYATPGSLTVKLRVTDDKGATNDASRTLTINNRPPTASFTVSPNPAKTGQNVIFNGSASSDLDGTIAKYEWDLDGDNVFETNTTATSTASRSYSVAGAITVGLRVTDSSGATAVTTRALTINQSSGPVASLSIAPNPARAGESVDLDGSASTTEIGTITTYEWDLDGDTTFETTTSTPTASSSYAAAGTLTLQLRVTDSNGLDDQTYGILTVEGSLPNPDPIPASFPAPIQSPPPSPPVTQQQSSTQPACVTARAKRIARVKRRLRTARHNLARARTAAAKRRYRGQVKSLTKRLKRLRRASC
jgi:PKD repeat protein